MVTITDSTLRANVYETIYDLVNGISFSLSSSNTVTVTAAFIDEDRAFPQVVIHPIDIESEKSNFDSTLRDRMIKVLIEVYTKKAKDLDQISDKVIDTLETGSTPGMMLVNIGENSAMNSPGQLKVHSKALSLTYVRRS